MKLSIKNFVAICLALALLFAFCACAPKQKNKDTLVIGTGISIENGVVGEYNFDMLASGVGNPPIVYVNSEGKLCERFISWESTDPSVWKLKFTKSFKWSDGAEISLSELSNSLSSEASASDQIKEMKVDGDKLVITLNSDNVRFIYDLCAVRLTKLTPYSSMFLFSGPYKLEEFSKDSQSVTFVKNPYWDGEVKYEKVIFKLFASSDSLNLALANGEIDLIWNYSSGLSEEEAEFFKDNKDIKIVSAPAAGCPVVLCFNLRSELLSDLAIRNTIYDALDFGELCEYLGGEEIGNTGRNFVSPASIGYSEITYNGSSSLLKPSTLPKLTLIVNSSNAQHVSAGEIVKRQLTAKGFSVDLKVLDKTAFQAKTTNSKSNGNVDFELAIMNFTAAGMNMKEGLGSIYIDGSHAVQGACGAGGEDFNALLTALREAKTLEKYEEAAKALQEWYSKEIPACCLYRGNVSYAYSKDLGDLIVDRNLGLNCMENFVK